MTATPSRARLVRFGMSDEFGSQQLGLSTVVAVAPVVFFACAVAAGGGLSWWLVVFAAPVALLVRWPESSGHLILWAGLLIAWVVTVPGPFTWWSVPAGLTVAASHTALSLLSGHPLAGALARDTWPRVRRRLGIVGGVVVGVAVLAQTVRSLRWPGTLAVTVVSLLIVAGWVWWGGRQVDVAGHTGAETRVPHKPV